MPLMQFIGSLIAVTIVALIAARMFRNPTKLTADRVLRNTARYCPHLDWEATTMTIISETGDSAIIILSDDEYRQGDAQEGAALVTTLGDRVVVRELTRETKIKASKTKTGISIDIDDFTQPKIEMHLDELSCKTLLGIIERRQLEQSEPAHA